MSDKEAVYIDRITVNGKNYLLRDIEVRNLISDVVDIAKVNELIASYHAEHPESDPTVGTLSLEEIAAIFDD